MPAVRAKFKVGSIIRRDGGAVVDGKSVEVQTIEMYPVYSSDPESENRKFWNSSPSGKLELGCVNLEAAAKFELGKEYYVDFTPAS